MYTNKEIKAVIFDVDNTLIATDRFVLEHIKETVDILQKQGVQVHVPSDEQISKVQAVNMPFEEIFQTVFPGVHANEQLWETVLVKYRETAPAKQYKPTVGAVDAVKYLVTHGIVVGLVTNRVRMIEDRLQQAGFSVNDFAFIHAPEKMEYRKPHPKAFEGALQLLKERGIASSQILVIGDHLDDYYASYYQHIAFLALLQGQTTKELFLEHGIEEACLVEDLQHIGKTLENVTRAELYKRSLYNTSALDGRHHVMSHELRHYFSEYALHKHRIMVEIEHVIALSEYTNGVVIRLFSQQEKETLRNLYTHFSEKDAYQVLQYDHLGRHGIGPTEHDVKSCELWIQEQLWKTPFADVIPAIHLFVTSEDINNLAYKKMLDGAMKDIAFPEVFAITDRLKELTEKYLSDPVMGRTHMQPASPTTFGKIFAGYLARYTAAITRVEEVKLTGKINGAVGNYNTFVAAYPEIDWKGYSAYLCRTLVFDTALWTDQRGTHVDVIQLFQALQEIGNITRDLAQDLSLYASLRTIYFSKIESHVGSSVMPHKVNPWFAEVAEGSIKKANGFINTFSNELDVSRLQRDLSDHEFERSYGEAFGYVLVAMKHLHIALDLIRPDVAYAKKELREHPEVVTEALQTMLRVHGRTDAYDVLKQKVRGANMQQEEFRVFIESLDVDFGVKQQMLSVLDPLQYIGLAMQLSQDAVYEYEKVKHRFVTTR